jgi:hypothetical protein
VDGYPMGLATTGNGVVVPHWNGGVVLFGN